MSDSDRLEELLLRYQTGELTSAEKVVLAGMLERDPDAARLAVEHFQWSTMIARGSIQALQSVADWDAGQTPLAVPRSVRMKPAKRGWYWISMAAGVALAAGAYAFLSHRVAPREEPGIAFLTQTGPGVTRSRAGEPEHPVGSGEVIRAGDVLSTSASGPATLEYGVSASPEGTRVELLPGTQAEFFQEDGAKRVRISQGSVKCSVAHQPIGRPFRLITPLAEAEVVGTRFGLFLTPQATRLEVYEGTVRLCRLPDRSEILVGEGEEALAGPQAELVGRPLGAASTGEVLLSENFKSAPLGAAPATVRATLQGTQTKTTGQGAFGVTLNPRTGKRAFRLAAPPGQPCALYFLPPRLALGDRYAFSVRVRCFGPKSGELYLHLWGQEKDSVRQHGDNGWVVLSAVETVKLEAQLSEQDQDLMMDGHPVAAYFKLPEGCELWVEQVTVRRLRAPDGADSLDQH